MSAGAADELPPTLVFVGGLHRSGTSLLAAMLATHPDISGLVGTGVPEDEGQHLQDVYPTAGAHGGPGRFARDPGAHLTERSVPVGSDHAARILAAWAPFWEQPSAFRVEKSPPNLIRSRYLRTLFPASHFAMLKRHPGVVSVRTQSRFAQRVPLHRLVQHWVIAHDILAGDMAMLDGVQAFHYEHLMADPSSVLTAITAPLGLGDDFDDSTVEPNRSDEAFDVWTKALKRTSRRKWRGLEAAVGRHGYRLESIDPL